MRAPTLLIVGGHDDVVIELNREAARHLRCEHRLEIVPRATHLFEEPGALETVATLAADWFTRHLAPLDRSARIEARHAMTPPPFDPRSADARGSEGRAGIEPGLDEVLRQRTRGER